MIQVKVEQQDPHVKRQHCSCMINDTQDIRKMINPHQFQQIEVVQVYNSASRELFIIKI